MTPDEIRSDYDLTNYSHYRQREALAQAAELNESLRRLVVLLEDGMRLVVEALEEERKKRN